MAIAPPPALSPTSLHTWTWRDYSIQFTQVTPSDDSVPLILVHGFGASIGHWKHNIPALAAAGYQVFAIDLLGFGASEKPVLEYSLELWQELLVDFARKFVQHPAVLIGNSIGGLLSLMLAVNHPELVRGIVLLNCAGGLSHRPDELPPLLRWVMGTFNALVNSEQLGPLMFNLVRRKPQIRRALQQVYRKPGSVTDELVEMLYKPSCDPNAQKVFAAILTAPPGPTIEELLPRLEKPMLVLWGEDDPWTPVAGSQIFQEHARSHDTEFISIPRTGHCPHDERPEIINPLVTNWLRSQLVRN
ncbi:MAG: alpha/beta fold hydrolase [Synechococcales cyanobacterium CRU_2_2]|nr:alpha/beta fold hydrolase [Synechococcales cyanobacterium CRU_2_2]